MTTPNMATHTVFNPKNNTNDTVKTLPFFGEPLNIQRYDKVAWPFVKRWYERGLQMFWRPEEIDVTKDKYDYETLQPHERHIFDSNIKRQIMLDSIQGRAPFETFLPFASSPEMEFAVIEWGRQEAVHSLSYTHILQNVFNDPSPVFDTVMEIREIVDCAGDIAKYYDGLMVYSGMKLAGRNFTSQDVYDAKKAFWRALFAANSLEGIRFYLSFACSFAFPQFYNGKMEGNAKVIRLIARDEQEHMVLTQTLLNRLPGIDNDFVKIREELRPECTALFNSVVDQEKAWGKYLFKDGAMIGINEKTSNNYIDWLAMTRLNQIGHTYTGEIVSKKSPYPFMEDWLNNKETQYALQEAEASDYLGAVTTGSVTSGLHFNNNSLKA